jgi:hypothetical protein
MDIIKIDVSGTGCEMKGELSKSGPLTSFGDSCAVHIGGCCATVFVN